MNLASEYGGMLLSQINLLKVCAIYGDGIMIYQALSDGKYRLRVFRHYKKVLLRNEQSFSYLNTIKPC